MPELPEVETVRSGLHRLLPDRVVASVTNDTEKGFPNAPADVDNFLIGSKIIDVRRRAKVLIIDLDTKYSLVIHLKMTGQMVYRGEQNFGAGHPSDSLVSELPSKSTRVILTFEDKTKLFFNDQRKFGWMRLLPTIEIPNLVFFQKVGPEPLSSEFTWKILKERMIRRKNSNVKSVLLDQTVLAGIGNIYADESLWGAQLHPLTLVKDITDKQFKTLYEEIVAVLQLAIDKGGSTDRNYVDAEGKKGSYLEFARVFHRQNKPCPRCGSIIIKTRVAGRGTHLCPNCQKL